MGTPDESVWPDIINQPYYKENFPKHSPIKLEDLITNLDIDGLDLLEKMLNYDPNQRITAKEALKHVSINIYSRITLKV